MHVIRHQDEGVNRISPLSPIFRQKLQKKLSMGVHLKQSPAIRSDRCDEVRPQFLRSEVVHKINLTSGVRNEKMTIVPQRPVNRA